MSIYESILNNSASGKKMLAVLIDPDKCDEVHLDSLCAKFSQASPDLIFVGGSLVGSDTDETVRQIRRRTDIPVVLFPGGGSQVTPNADAMLLLSLISGRNAEYLIGQHVNSALKIKQSGLEIIPTGYILIDGGRVTSVQYISNTMPIPHDKIDIAVATAMAGEMLGLKMLYLEAGSGAQHPVPLETIAAVRKNVDIPLIVGGGIRDGKAAMEAVDSGADIIVVGTAFENNPSLLVEIRNAIKK